MSKVEKVTAIRHVYPHFDLNIACNIALKEAIQKKESWESFHFSMTSMLFCSFTLEAYINHVGISKIKYWPKIKEKLSIESKLEILADKFNFSFNKSCRPFQTLTNIVQFRNLMVHAQSYTIIDKTIKNDPQQPKSKWEKMVTIKNAGLFKKDTEKILLFIQKNTDMIIDPISAGGGTMFLTDDELRLNQLSHLTK